MIRITMKSAFTLLSLSLFLSSIVPSMAKDEVYHVDSMQIAGPFPLVQPIMMDSLNKAKKTFSPESYLEANKPNWQALSHNSKVSTQIDNAPLPKVSGKASLSFLYFTLACSEFTKGQVEVKGIKHFKVYTDDKAASDKFTFSPGNHQIVIACLSKDEQADTARVSVRCSAGSIEIHPQHKRRYTLHDVTDGLSYSGISLSPSGKYAVISYTQTSPNGKVDRTAQLVEVSTNKVLIPALYGVGSRWLTNRDALYYMKDNDGKFSLHLLEVPSFSETVLAEDMPNLPGWTLSPNLKYVVYTSNDDKKDQHPDLKLFNMPDDRLYDSKTHTFLHLYDLATGVSHQLTFGQTTTHLEDISDDGSQILFSTSKMELHRFPFNHSNFYCYYPESGRLDTLLTDVEAISHGEFSPDGTQILFTAYPDAFNGIGKAIPSDHYSNMYDIQLYLFHIQSRTAKPLTKDFNPSVSRTSWSRADGHIYFTAANRSKTSLYCLNLTRNEIRQIPTEVSIVSGFSVAQGANVLAYFGQGPTYARKLYVTHPQAKKSDTRKMGRINFETMYADVDFPTFKYWSYLSTRGDSIHGFYYLPPQFDAEKKYPMIVYYYGGCTPTPERLEMNYPFAVWASQGYVVYVVEPSGAIGFGQEFSSRHVNTWGKGSSDDILEGVQKFCSEHPFVNTERLACIGASYGGFMTEYLLTRTKMFRTAIAHAGISDLTGYWGAGNWGYTYSQVAASESYPWNNRELYVEQSPLYHADQITTPLLLIQGSLDNNVPANQAWQLYTALKILNREVEFIQVKDENHVITDYKKQKQWQEAICAWFARWLKDEPVWWENLYPKS